MIGLQSDLGIPAGKRDPPSVHLRLGATPRDSRLEKDVQRELQANDEDPTLPGSTGEDDDKAASGVPLQGQGLPYPGGFRVADVKREVEKIREARKRIRLGPEAFKTESALDGDGEKEKQALLQSNKPSVCLFTVHDAAQT